MKWRVIDWWVSAVLFLCYVILFGALVYLVVCDALRRRGG